MQLRPVVDDLWIVASSQAAPGHGTLPVNAYVVTGGRSLLIDTGLAADRQELLTALWPLVAPDRLAAVFLTHEDGDHAGNLLALLEAAPTARLVTSFVTLGKLRESTDVPLDRVHVANPGEPIPGFGGRFRVVRPPLFDAPGTIGLHDAATGAVLTVDAFGTYLPRAVGDLSELGADEILRGLVDFNRVNHPWVSEVDPARFGATVDALLRLEPAVLLSSHGLAAREHIDLLASGLRRLPIIEPYRPPDQQAFRALRPEMDG